MSFDKIDEELKAYEQWIVWKAEYNEGDPKPIKRPYCCKTERRADVTDRKNLTSFKTALSLYNEGGYNGLGFVLTNEDPFSFIDLDDCKGDVSLVEKHTAIFNHFDSYSEISPSGLGLHIIVKGGVPSGRKRSGVEIYSTARFMTMTGNTYNNKPIKEQSDLLNTLWTEIGRGEREGSSTKAEYFDGDSTTRFTDEEIIKTASEAKNSEKFLALYNGDWKTEFESQSSADQALMNMFTYYSQNREQVIRLFHSSALGKRKKAKRKDYIDWTVNRAFDRALPPIDIGGLSAKIKATVLERKQKEAIANPSIIERVVKQNETPLKLINPSPVATTKPTIFPGGLVGEIAQFIYDASPRPVAEIALVGALGLMPGIIGRAYNVSGTGLNQYWLILASTGTGKEGLLNGIDLIMDKVIELTPAAEGFIGPSQIASGQAVLKYIAKGNNSFVSVMGEFGMLLDELGANARSPAMKTLRRFFLDAYNKSGKGRTMGKGITADLEKTAQMVRSPAFSMVGDTTPEKFYGALDDELVQEGFIPRLNVLEYKGPRVKRSEVFLKAVPDKKMIEALAGICAHACTLNSQDEVINVQFDKEGGTLMDEFDTLCDININSNASETLKSIWTRGHVKAMKVAAVVAVGMNPYSPTITKICAEWSIALVLEDLKNMTEKFRIGKIGSENSELRQIEDVCEAVRFYIESNYTDLKNLLPGSFKLMHEKRVIPYSYFSRRLTRKVSFRTDRFGATSAIRKTLDILQDRGELQEISRAISIKDYGSNSKAYAITNVEGFYN